MNEDSERVVELLQRKDQWEAVQSALTKLPQNARIPIGCGSEISARLLIVNIQNVINGILDEIIKERMVSRDEKKTQSVNKEKLI